MVVMQHCHPKGCYCQVGSVFKTALFLVLIVGVSTALAVWIYQNKFQVSKEDDDRVASRGDNDRVARELDLIQLLRAGGGGGAQPEVFIDSGGTLRRLVSGKAPGEGGEFGPAHLAPAGERARVPLPVEAIESVTPAKRPRTILEEILQHLDSGEELDVGQSEEETGPDAEQSGRSCRVQPGRRNRNPD